MAGQALVLDTSGLLAALDNSHRQHGAVAQVMNTLDGPFVLSQFILAEMDYLLGKRFGRDAQRMLLEDVENEAYELASFSSYDVRLANDVLGRYRDLDLGIADASLVVLAARYGTDNLLTLDQRHFRVVQTLDQKPFRLLPSDDPA